MNSNIILRIVEGIAFLLLIGIYSLLFSPLVIFIEGIEPIHIVAFSASLVGLNLIYGTISTWLKHRGKYISDDTEFLYEPVTELAEHFGTKTPRVVVFETDMPNAYATDTLPTRPIIALTSGLYDTLNDDEMQAVIAHEMAHIDSYDVYFMQFLATFVAVFKRLHNITSSFMFADGNDAFEKVVALPFYILTWINLMIVYTIVFFVSRVREYIADTAAAEATSPDAMVSALEKITDAIEDTPADKQMQFASSSALTIAPIDHFKNKMFKTHPKTASRIERLQSKNFEPKDAYERNMNKDDTEQNTTETEPEKETEETQPSEEKTNETETKPEQTTQDSDTTSDRKTVTEKFSDDDTDTDDTDDDINYPTDLSFKD